MGPSISQKINNYPGSGKYCDGPPLGQSFVLSGSEVCSLQDEDHSGSRPHSFTGLCRMRSGTSSEQFRSGPELAGSGESHRGEIARLKCAFPPTELLGQRLCYSTLNFLRNLSDIVFLRSGNI